jgi:hypothetical protein
MIILLLMEMLKLFFNKQSKIHSSSHVTRYYTVNGNLAKFWQETNTKVHLGNRKWYRRGF